MKRRRSSRGSFARRVRPYAGAALRLGVRAYRSWTKNSNKKRGTAGVGVTNQYDARNIYRRKRMPRYKRKQWKKFVHKVRAVARKDLATLSIVRNQANVITSSAGGQSMDNCCLYGLEGSNGIATSSMGADDLTQIVANATYGANKKILFQSGVLDLTMVNTDASASVEVDCYRYFYRKQSDQQSATAVLVQGFANTSTVGAGAALAITTRGVTPFQCPSGMHYLKILAKKKYLLSPGQAATYQIRDPKNRTFDVDEIGDNTGGECKLGWTQGVIIVIKGIPSLASPSPAAQLTVGCTRTYSYLVNDQSLAQDAFIA